MTTQQLNAVQRYKVGYSSDAWGDRSSTPTCIPAHDGAWVSFSDMQALQAGYDAARLQIESLQSRLDACQKSGQDWAMRVHALEEEVAHESQWRDLALQFDGHRMRALGHLKKILDAGCSDDSLTQAQDFLHAPPLSGEKVLAERIAAELEASKAQCEPLDEEAIERATGVKRGTPMFLAATGFVRATERAHGITQENQQ